MNLLKALATVGSMTFLSRILGFVRDTLIARVFGAGLYTDAFFVAFKIPNLLRRLFAEGAFSQAFVPVLAEYKNRRGHDDFISLVSLAGGVLNTYNRFSVPAFTPVWLNLSFIVAALFFADYFNQPIMVLAWAVFVGGVLQLAFQVPFLLKIGLVPKFSLNLHDEGVWRILKLMGPAVFGVSIAQISLLINTIFASFLETGSVSWLYYADRLMEFPAGMLGVALGTILLPSLSKSFADKADGEYSELLDWGLRLTFILALPAAVALAVLAVPLVTSLFHYGAFTEHDMWMTRQALMAYSLGLLGLILVKVLAPAFYSRQNIKTPVKIAIFTLCATQLMNIVFVFGVDLEHAGLALSIGLGACINAGLLYYHLRKADVYKPQPGWTMFMLKLLVAVAAMAAVLYVATGSSEAWLQYKVAQKLLHLAGLIALGAVTNFGVLWLLGIRVKDFMRRVVV